MKRQLLFVAMIIFLLSAGIVSADDSNSFSFYDGFSSVVKKTSPAVVSVVVSGAEKSASNKPRGPEGPEGPQSPNQPNRPEKGAGSGVIINPAGYIVTNNHVVDGAKEITVLLNDKEFSAKLVGTDPKSDIAVLKIDAENLPFLKWGATEKLEVGDLVLAIGDPFGLTKTVSLGIISALGRSNVGIVDYEDFIQTDAAINPGNSGGALVNMKGELIGINTAIFSRTGGSEGIGFAVPQSTAENNVASLMKNGRVIRGWMGVAIQNLNPMLAKSFNLPQDLNGVLVSDVNEIGPAKEAGMERGDVIFEFNGKAVKDVNELRKMVSQSPLGKKASVKVFRRGAKQELFLTVSERPADEALVSKNKLEPQKLPEAPKYNNAFSDLTVVSVDEMRAKLEIPATVHGVVITDVKKESVAEESGLLLNDIIQEINHQPVNSVSDYNTVALSIGKKDTAVLLVNRMGNFLFIALSPRSEAEVK